LYSKKFLSNVHWKIGQQEKGSGNRTIIGQSRIRNGLRQEGKYVRKGQMVKRKKVVRQIMYELTEISQGCSYDFDQS